MEIFRNSPAPYYDQLVSMGPKWLAEFREFNANYKYAAWTLELMAYHLDQMIRNQFPRYCDLKHLDIYEQILNIDYPYEVDEDERRRTVLAFWSGNGKLSKSSLEGILSAYTGQESNIFWDGLVLVLDFDNTVPTMVHMDMLRKIVRRKMPAHIDYRIRVVCSVKVGLKPGRKLYRHVFDQVGTLPGVNVGLALRKPVVKVDPTAVGHKANRLYAGNTAVVTGEYPITNIGCVRKEVDLEVDPVAEGHKAKRIYAGDSETVTGEFPITNIRYIRRDMDVEVDPEAEGYKSFRPMAGDTAGETGTRPNTNIGYEESGDSLVSEVTARGWALTYQLCGDDNNL